MAHRTVHRLACLVTLLVVTASKEQTRWSRQISSYTADISDWVPLTGPVEREPARQHHTPPKTQHLPPIKRQAVAEPRILTEPFPGFSRPTGFGQDNFPPRNFYSAPANRQLYLQSVPSAPQNYLTDQGFGQSIRFGLSQPNFPLSQGFIAPQYSFENVPAIPPVKQRPVQQALPPNPVKYENFQKQNLPTTHTKNFVSQQIQPRPEKPKFVDGYRAENITQDFTFSPKKKVQSLQKIKFENYDKSPKIESIPSKPKVEREEVQLLYVPVESLNRGQFNYRTQQLGHPELYSQSLPKPNPLKQAFSSELQKPVAKPIDTFSTNQDYFSNYEVVKNDQVPKFSTISSPFPSAAPTTPKPKKLKPHQPPLAIFMTQESKRGNQLKVGDVLSSLKSANTVAVLDTVNPNNAPKVFIGPSSLKPPENFVKFELPYLSNIENSDKKLRQLPFFVAPLSYNTPNGFAKIPFPSPHVGSVVINSQIRDTSSHSHPTHSSYSTPTANVIPNSYSAIPQDVKSVTQKPNFSYYSTSSPKTNAPAHHQQHSNYYSIEPQMVTAVPHLKEPESNYNASPQKTGSYFLTNVEGQYNPTQYINLPSEVKQDPINQYNYIKQETTTTPRTTVTTTTTRPSTYPSQLLETHNPYSINQAFHFSTPLDYHSFYDEYKDPLVTPGANEAQKTSPSPAPPSSSIATKPQEVVTEKQAYEQSLPSRYEQSSAVYQQQAPVYQQQQQPLTPQQSSPNYLQNYNPEIHYESEVSNSRYPIYNTNEYTTKPDVSSENYQSVKELNAEPVPPVSQPAYNQPETPHVNSHEHIDYNPSSNENLTETIINKITGPAGNNDSPKQVYDKYESSFETDDSEYTSSTTSTTTTTRRTPIRNRGRPRYTTAKPETSESTTRTSVTRRPLRERRPLPTRSRYEPNKITTERTTSKTFNSGESTTTSTKTTRTRTRGRVQYKPSENDDSYSKRNKIHSSKEADLAYQRDVLHQNYPVTLMERMSTVDIEAITEPSPKIASTKTLESVPESYDTENAYAHDSASISYIENSPLKEETQAHSFGTESHTEETYVPKLSSTRGEEYFYQTRSSAAPIQAIASYEDTYEKQEDKPKETTPEVFSYATEPTSSTAEQSQPNYSVNTDVGTTKNEEDTQTSQDLEITKVGSQETNHETETEENIVQTTPSYNRVRVRPGVIRQYHQASSTERAKIERKRPVQAVTYRPAFDRRRTTMRIEEIEADLKTKQIHSRPEVQDYKHPVYRPEPTTEPTITIASSFDSTTKRGHFRRRRPVYTTTSTESSITKKNAYEIKSRFRGRRPTEKPTEKTEVHTEALTSTVKSTTFNRYSHRPRLSERYNKKPDNDAEETEDQESNYSINRPKYAAPESEQWSPKISVDSFKPYNPNDIVEDAKLGTTEQKTENEEATLDIITARNDYDDILISVTPATNNRANKKIPDIPPTLEALVEQSKTIKNDSNDSMSTFETMLEEVMKSLEEQDEDEYTTNVMKHKGGEIGEIPPERVISSGEDFNQKSTAVDHEITTPIAIEEDSSILDKEQIDRKGRRRGYWKKVKVRPVSTETIETAESQYYSNTVNSLGEPVALSKVVHGKSDKYDNPKLSVTTYKPTLQFIKDLFEVDDEIPEEEIPTVDIPKIDKIPKVKPDDAFETERIREETTDSTTTVKSTSLGEEDLGTGSPDPTIMDSMYYSTPTEPTSSENVASILDRSDGFSFMDYLFGVTSTGTDKSVSSKNKTITTQSDIEITTEQIKSKIATTESTYIPEEITAVPSSDENTEIVTEITEIRKLNSEKQETTETPIVNIETSSASSFMNPDNVVSTSMSTEISHETEICFRGKCIKTNKDLL